MKRIFLLCVLLISFVQCDDERLTPEISAELGKDFNLKHNQTVKISTNLTSVPFIKLKLVDVKGGFCHPNAQCITAGSATIKIGKGEDNFTSPIEMCKGECESSRSFIEIDSVSFLYKNNNYRLIFKKFNVDYHKKKFSSKFKDVTLSVEKL